MDKKRYKIKVSISKNDIAKKGTTNRKAMVTYIDSLFENFLST